VISAVRDLNRLEPAGETVRAAVEVLAVTAADWLATVIDIGEWAQRYGARVDSWRLPSSQVKRDRLAQVYGRPPSQSLISSSREPTFGAKGETGANVPPSGWGLRLYLVCTPTGMPILWALANPKLGEREVLAAMLEVEAGVVAEHPGILLISDKGFASKAFERDLAEQGIELLRPSRKREKARYGEQILKKVRQLIESVNDTLKGQLDLEEHGGRTFDGVAVRVAQRLLAMAAAIWHNNKTGAPVTRSLITYDH
jgi:hypothetical protein